MMEHRFLLAEFILPAPVPQAQVSEAEGLVEMTRNRKFGLANRSFQTVFKDAGHEEIYWL